MTALGGLLDLTIRKIILGKPSLKISLLNNYLLMMNCCQKVGKIFKITCFIFEPVLLVLIGREWYRYHSTANYPEHCPG
jgi:hypothetical protein